MPNGTMTIQGAQLVRRKPKDGAPGKPGTDGNGIASLTTYFATTNKPHLAQFADLAASEWRTTFPTATLEKPYVWKCVLTKYTKQASVYSTPELVTTYHSGDNYNLIENAAFTNDNNMQAWSTISQYAPIKGSTAPTDKGHVDLDTTLQQHHAFVDQCRATEVTIYYKDMLAQVIHAPKQGIHKLTGGQWYTLSFWAKMSSPSPTVTNDLLTYLHPTAVDTATPMIIDGNETPATQADANVGWKLTAEWTRHTVTFKTRATLPEADKQTLLFRLPPSPGLFNPRTVWLCMPKLEEGMFATGFVDTPSDLKGDSGITVRRSEWQLGVNYRNDTANGAQSADGHRYLDEVSVTNLATGKAEWFVARALHNGTTSTAVNKPTTGGNNYWEPVNDMRPIHTSYADIMTAFIQFLQVNQLTITDNKGTVYGAFGGGNGMDYPLWFGGKTANEAVTKFDKEGSFWSGDNFSVVKSCLTTTGKDTRVTINNGNLEIFGKNNQPNIRLGINADGCAVLMFYDKAGNYIYDLGPSGLSQINTTEAYFNNRLLKAVDIHNAWASVYKILDSDATTYYEFHSKRTTTPAGTKYWYGGEAHDVLPTEEGRNYNNSLLSQDLPTGTLLPIGWYAPPNNGTHLEFADPSDNGSGVTTKQYTCPIFYYEGGKITATAYVKWKKNSQGVISNKTLEGVDPDTGLPNAESSQSLD